MATKAEAWPDLRAAVDVVTLLLAQSSASTGTALGFQGLRTTRASRIVGLVVFFAVDHAQYAMGEVRTVDDASKMVAATTARLVSVVFPRAMSAGAVLKIFNRVKAADPMGWSPLLQRARRLQDI